MTEDFVYGITSRCTFCATCFEVCEHRAVESKPESFVIDEERCVLCGRCYENCPSEAIDKHSRTED